MASLASLTSNKSFNLVFPQTLNATSYMISCRVKNSKAESSICGNKLQQKKLPNVVGKKCKDEKWRLFGSDDGSCGIAPMGLPPSVLGAVEDFYKAINGKDIQMLEQLLADDCQYQDLVFYAPFKGKQVIIPFLSKVMEAMGSSIHFAIDDVSEGENLTASVIWHLEWRNKHLPFTTGCTFFEYEEDEGDLLLRKVIGVEEFLFKPGNWVLKILKSVSRSLPNGS